MPRGLVQTEEEAACWEKAKAIASEHFGHLPSADVEWAYVMGIYKHMCIRQAEAREKPGKARHRLSRSARLGRKKAKK